MNIPNPDLYSASAQRSVAGFDSDLSAPIGQRFDPNSTNASTVRKLKGVITNDHSRTFDLKEHFTFCKRAGCAKLIHGSKCEARGIGSVPL